MDATIAAIPVMMSSVLIEPNCSTLLILPTAKKPALILYEMCYAQMYSPSPHRSHI